jgi:hypothetical protein
MATDGEPTHAARQLPNGKWTSKLGRWQDIEHELDGLVGEMYGTVKQILKRAIEYPVLAESAMAFVDAAISITNMTASALRRNRLHANPKF